MLRNAAALFDNPDGGATIKDVCNSNGMIFAEIKDLVRAEAGQMGSQHKEGLWGVFDDILDRFQI